VRQLAAAFLPASLLAGISTRAQIPATKLARTKAAASCRTQSGLCPHKHWVWDTGLLQHIDRNPGAFAAELESQITPQDKAKWRVVALNFSSADAGPSPRSGQALKVGATSDVRTNGSNFTSLHFSNDSASATW